MRACRHHRWRTDDPSGIVELTEKIKEIDQHITIETAGTMYQKLRCDLMSISPKLSNSTPHDREEGKFAAQHEELRYQPDVLKQLIAEYNYQLKFVISSVDDVREAREMVREIGAATGSGPSDAGRHDARSRERARAMAG